MAALGISAAVPPSAAAQVNWSAVRNLARVAARVPRPQVIAGAVEAAGAVRYGVADVAVVSQLDDAGRALGAHVDETAAGVGATSEASTFRKCVGEGLTAAGQSYKDELREASDASSPVPAPSYELVISGASNCLQHYYPDVPDAAAQLGEHLASLAMEQAVNANQAAGSGVVLAAWMQTTGAELANAGVTTDAPLPTSPAVASGSSDGSDAADGDGFPVGAAIAVVALLIGVGAWLKLRDS